MTPGSCNARRAKHTDPRYAAPWTRAPPAGDTARAVLERKALLIRATANSDLEPPTSAIIGFSGAGVKQALGAIALEAHTTPRRLPSPTWRCWSALPPRRPAPFTPPSYTPKCRNRPSRPLTGFTTGAASRSWGRRRVERSLRFGHSLSAMMLDIDLFKQINDIHGHLTGDRVLVGVTHHCAQELRQIDLLGRYGGDESSSLLLPGDKRRECLPGCRAPAAPPSLPSPSAPRQAAETSPLASAWRACRMTVKPWKT